MKSSIIVFIAIVPIACILAGCRNSTKPSDAAEEESANETTCLEFRIDDESTWPDSLEFKYDSIGVSFFKYNDSNNTRNYKKVLRDMGRRYAKRRSLSPEEIEEMMPRTPKESEIYYHRYFKESKDEGGMSFLHYCDSVIWPYCDSLFDLYYVLLNRFEISDFIALPDPYVRNYLDGLETGIDSLIPKHFRRLYRSLDDSLKQGRLSTFFYPKDYNGIYTTIN